LGANSPLQSQVLKLSDGEAGNRETVALMRDVARNRAHHDLVRAKALKILKTYNVSSQNHIAEALAIGDFVKNNVTYRRDPDDQEYLQDPLTMIENLSRNVANGDCDDMSLLIATLLLSVGARPFFRCVKYSPKVNYFEHIYVVVYDKNWNGQEERVVLDAILKRSPIGTEVQHSEGTEFEI
jgi:hypothetical protein